MPNSKIASEDEPASQFWRSASLIWRLASCTTAPAHCHRVRLRLAPCRHCPGSLAGNWCERARQARLGDRRPERVARAGLRADGEPVPDEVGAPQLLAVTVAA
jgi:hypothetical protein